jgi:hypothetical protein
MYKRSQGDHIQGEKYQIITQDSAVKHESLLCYILQYNKIPIYNLEFRAVYFISSS